MGTGTVILDCACVGEPDIATIECIARLQIAMRRRGCELRLRGAGAAFVDLIALCGLAGVLCIEVHRQVEQGEQPRRVEEEGDLRNPAV
jgi:anti-anti-sigma regulatory factor